VEASKTLKDSIPLASTLNTCNNGEYQRRDPMGEKVTEREYEQFFQLLEKIVNEDATVPEKADRLKEAGTETDVTNLFEFAAWWDVDEEDEDNSEDSDENSED
jgi:hypothetical protein